MSDKKVELNAENLEDVAGGAGTKFGIEETPGGSTKSQDYSGKVSENNSSMSINKIQGSNDGTVKI